MRTITFEWKKFCSFRYFWFLCGIVLLFNLWTLSENRKWEWFSGESLKAIYTDFHAQPEEKQEQWLERLGEKKYAVYADTGGCVFI